MRLPEEIDQWRYPGLVLVDGAGAPRDDDCVSRPFDLSQGREQAGRSIVDAKLSPPLEPEPPEGLLEPIGACRPVGKSEIGDIDEMYEGLHRHLPFPAFFNTLS